MIVDELANLRRYSAPAEFGPVKGYRAVGKLVSLWTERSGDGGP